MSEKENKEELIIDEVVEETVDGELVNEVEELVAGDDALIEEEGQLEGIEEEKVIVELEEGNLFHKILASILDQAVVLGCGALLLVGLDLIIRIIGYRVARGYHIEMLLIMYFVANALYLPIMSKLKGGRSLGKRIMNII